MAAVLRAVKLVMSLLAPVTAALSAERAEAASVPPVPPRATASVPVAALETLRAVAFVRSTEVGVPSMGVVSVGEVLRTTLPEPVEPVTPVPPRETGSACAVVTDVLARLRPEAFVRTTADGVPRLGVVSDGLVANTSGPEPVSSMTATARLADVGVARNVATLVPRPLTPVDIGRSVAFVRVAKDGVPMLGVVSTGEVLSTTPPEPVDAAVTPVPPRETGSA
jgi:hypothetical protein